MAAVPDAIGSGGASGAGGADGARVAGDAGDADGLGTYDMTGHKYLLIFNHYEYQQTEHFSEPMETRYGTAFDVAALARVFGARGFRVSEHHDRTHDQILQIVADFCKLDHSDTACAAVAVLTHGLCGGRVAAADRWYALRDLVQPLQGTALAGRPKLVLAQACRGQRLDAGLRLDGDAAPRVGTHADTLIFYSTVEDFVSWRASNGSWVMQELCRALDARPALDAQRLATLVTANVTNNYVSSSVLPLNQNKKQTPETCSTLTKLLYFTPPAPPATPAPPAPPAPSAPRSCQMS